MFTPLIPAAAGLEHFAEWPERHQIEKLLAAHTILSGGCQPLRLVAPHSASSISQPGYETRCFLTGELETREKNWHDLFNFLAWLTFPQAKAALNARHYQAQQSSNSHNGRGPQRDALTLFDECGAVVVSADPSLLSLLREFAWKELFWHRREDVLADMQVYLFGHGLYEQVLHPFIGLTGKAVLLPVEQSFLQQPLERQLACIDQQLAGLIANPDRFKHTHELSPLPILGVPGWAADNAQESFYENTGYFRPGRRSRPS